MHKHLLTCVLTLLSVASMAGTEVIPEARFKGNYGLRVTPDGDVDLTNSDITVPTAFRIRFYMRLTQLALLEDQVVTVFKGQDAGSNDVFRVLVGRHKQQHRLGFEVRRDDGTYAQLATTSGVVLSAGWHALEFAWSSEVGDGYLQYQLDGAVQAGLSKLDNDLTQLATVSIGLMDPSGSLAGFADFDELEARISGEIGTICFVPGEILGQLPNWPSPASVLNLITLYTENCN